MRMPIPVRLACLMAAAAPIVPATGQIQSMGDWLVDLGRDYPMSPQAGLSDADAEITLLFMEAAVRLEPDHAEAHLWRFDMLEALDRAEQAEAALAEYVRCRPEDLAARLSLQARQFDALQTVEQRESFCREKLARPDLPEAVRSDLHRRLAELHAARGETEQARREAQAALAALDLNFAARGLLNRLDGRHPGPSERIETLLRELSVNPADAAAAIDLAEELSNAGLTDEADEWLAHAESLEMADLGQASPGLRAARVRRMLASARAEEAQAAAAELVQAVPEDPQARLLWAETLEAAGKPQEALSELNKVGGIYKALLARTVGPLDADMLAEMAWFFAHHDPQPAEAARLARLALAQEPESTVARRALGAALRQEKDLGQAVEVLTAVAGRDAWSAAELARAMHESGRTAEAAEVLGSALSRPAEPQAREALLSLAGAWGLPAGGSRPSREDPAEIRKLLESFDRRVLDYPLHPERYLSIRWGVGAERVGPAQPWICSVRIENRGPFPLTVGDGLMVSPDFLIAIETRGDQVRRSGPIIRLSLNRKPRLMPGDAVEVRQSILIGPIRSSMIGTPQMEHEVELTGVLGPERVVTGEGEVRWVPRVGGLMAEPVRFKRTAFVPTVESQTALIARSRSTAWNERIAALELLAMLAGERQHLQAGRLTYRARRIEEAAVRAAIRARAADDRWEVRARLAECLRWFVLDEQDTRAATGLLSDPHWLVRGLTMRALAEQHRERFLPVLNRAAEADPDAWVRRMADALARRRAAAPPQTAPAPGIAGAPEPER